MGVKLCEYRGCGVLIGDKSRTCRRHSGNLRRLTVQVNPRQQRLREVAMALPNFFCPNPYPGAETCGAFAPHRHCECGFAIGTDEPAKPCEHDPIGAIELAMIFERFPATPAP